MIYVRQKTGKVIALKSISTVSIPGPQGPIGPEGPQGIPGEGADLSAVDFVRFLETSTAADLERTMRWNAEDGCVEAVMRGGTVVAQLPLESLTDVRNANEFPILNGKVLAAVGAAGDKINVGYFNADGSMPPEMIVGMSTEVIPANNGAEGKGFVVTRGALRAYDTSAWPVFTILYPSGAQGDLTATPPTTGVKIPLAVVLRQHATTGIIYVRLTPIDLNAFGSSFPINAATAWDGASYPIVISKNAISKYKRTINSGVSALVLSITFPSSGFLGTTIVEIDNSANATAISSLTFGGGTWAWDVGVEPTGLAAGAKAVLTLTNLSDTEVLPNWTVRA